MIDAVNTPDTINVKDYGAAGNGIKDDSAAFKKAIKAAQARIVYFPAGQYNLNNINITVKTELNIAGESDGLSILLNPGIMSCSGNVSVRDLTITDNKDIFIYMTPVGMSNLTLNHVSYTGKPDNTRLAYCKSTAPGIGIGNVEVVNCTITDTRYGLMLTCPINSGLISGNTFDRIGDPAVLQGVAAINLGYMNSKGDSARNITISDNRITNVAAGYSTKNDGRELHGILLLSDGGCVVENNYLENIMGGMDAEGIYTKAVDIKILNNTLINAGDGNASIVNKRSSDKNDIIISGNTIVNDSETKATCGIYVSSTNYTISNNNITIKSGMAIYKQDGTIDGVITHNTIDDYGRTAIYINEITGKALISDNKISLIRQGTVKLDAVINFANSKAGATITITNNEIYAESTYLFNSLYVGKGTSFDISNNKVNFKVRTAVTLSDKLIGLAGVSRTSNQFTII